MGFRLIAYVNNYSDDEGCVSEDTTSHAEVVGIYVEKLLVVKWDQAAKLVNHRIRINVHYHTVAKLNVARLHTLSGYIPHWQDCLTIQTYCVDVCRARVNIDQDHIRWKFLVTANSYNVSESDIFLRLCLKPHFTVAVNMCICQIVQIIAVSSHFILLAIFDYEEGKHYGNC